MSNFLMGLALGMFLVLVIDIYYVDEKLIKVGYEQCRQENQPRADYHEIER
jgi:hypothetical protein